MKIIRHAVLSTLIVTTMFLATPANPVLARRPTMLPTHITLPLPLTTTFAALRLGATRGDIVTALLPNGSTRPMSLTPTQIASLQAGRSMLVARGAAVQVMPSVATARGIVSRVMGRILVLSFPNGTLQSFALTPGLASFLTTNLGNTILARTSTAFTSPLRPNQIVLVGTANTPIIGTFVRLNGSFADVLVAGRVQTFDLRPVHNATIHTGERVAMFGSGRTMTRILPAMQTIRGQIVSVSRNSMTLLLPNGSTQVVGISLLAQRRLLGMIGSNVIVSTSTAFAAPVSAAAIQKI